MWPFSDPLPRWAGWTEMPRCRHADRNPAEMNAAPWSITIVSGTITGRAAACSSLEPMSSSRS
jgi:hypothetical protein